MKDGDASKTALLVAGLRARASARAAPLCSDPYARAFAGEEGLALADRFAAEVFPHAELWIALRTAAIDDAVRALAAERAASQIVILGAGFDARAARMKVAGARWFEVDHPATRAEKLRRLAGVSGYPVDAATHVACDFAGEDFLDRLTAAGFDAGAPAVFVWEGVAMYLPEAAVRRTLSRIASGTHARSAVVFDLLGKRFARRTTAREEDEAVHASVADMGEPVLFGTDDVLPLLYEEGFRWVRARSFDELALERTGTYDRARAFRFQHVCTASATAP
jgi:methyltransferase (TIGR00027 family)